MEQKFKIGLNAAIKKFATKFGIDREKSGDNALFEDFGNYIVASLMREKEIEDLQSISTNKAEGIDGIVVLINGKLITEENDLSQIGSSENINLKIGFIQSTTEKSFNTQKFSAFTDAVINFLTDSLQIEPFSTICNRLLDENGQYTDLMETTPRISLYFLSARTEHQITEDLLSREKSKFADREGLSYKYRLDDIFVFQGEAIQREFEKIAKFDTVQLKFDANVQLAEKEGIDMSLLTLIKFSELKKLILTSNNNLKDGLFVENVRDYIGKTPVNLDIEKSLNSENMRNFFPYLNNGLTIICDSLLRHPTLKDTFSLTFPRIINGCQTTNTLYLNFKNSNDPEKMDDIGVIAKIISTKNDELKKAIIYAANNQNSITNDLQSLNDFHKKIEQFFEGKNGVKPELYYERLRGQYPSVTPPYRKINIETLAKIYISVFLKEPEKMKSHALSKIEEYQNAKKIFNNEGGNLEDYYYCGVLNYWLVRFISNKEIEMKSKTMDMHLLMACDLLLANLSLATTNQKIEHLVNEDHAKSLFSEGCRFLNKQEFLFERRGFYATQKTKNLIEEIRKLKDCNVNAKTEN